jgi:hypothetical protein
VAVVKARVRKILDSGDAGRKELLKDIQEGLLEAMYLEREAGTNPASAGHYTEGNARASRKQFKELAELVMEVVLEVDR